MTIVPSPRALAWTVAALAPGTAACSGAQSSMAPAGPAAQALARLGGVSLVVLGVAAVATLVLLVWAVWRRRGTLAEHAPADAGGGQRWILVGGALIPAVVLAGLFVLTLRTMSAFPIDHHAAGEPEIRVIGRQWWWEAVYERGPVYLRVTSPTEIHIPAGRPVDIALETRDVIHSFWVPTLHGKVDLVPGRVNRIRLQAGEPGVYRGECAEYCGMQHAHMVFLVVARPEDEFEQWLAHQRRPARPPDTDQTRLGRDLFMTRACVTCHAIRGTGALATVGPELTHVAGRRLIAGGMLDNNLANMHAWVTSAQSIKPGARMPNVTEFTGPELHALVAYLRTLE